MSSSARTAAPCASCTTPVAIALARSARDRHARSGSPRQAELLPVPYFHVVFTLPARAAEIAFQNKAVVYAMLFRCAAETLTIIAADPKHLSAQLGVTAVLHTRGQTLQHHPHVHCVMPGGGLSLDNTRWIACRPGFFLPVRVLSRLFRRVFLNALQAAFAAGQLGFFGVLAPLAEPAAFAQRLDQARRTDCRVGGDVAAPTPHRSGRAGFPASGSSREREREREREIRSRRLSRGRS